MSVGRRRNGRHYGQSRGLHPTTYLAKPTLDGRVNMAALFSMAPARGTLGAGSYGGEATSNVNMWSR
eukprot:scaffold18574_cov48-Cyclotella_meneghiniana.AAC.1